ncbi:hypothetical protein CNV14_08605 [Campylobacter coli]|nr:hypothetical protein [Campylobacter coli]
MEEKNKYNQCLLLNGYEFLDFENTKNTNTAYACAIQARFEQNKIVKIEPKYCISLINTCFDSKEITLDNDISRVGLNDVLSKRTIDFVNRFKLLKHQPNTTNCLMKKQRKLRGVNKC